MSEYFSGKVFLVTGASSGIGRALSLEFLSRGAVVAGMARSKDRLHTLEKEYGKERCIALPGDVSIEADCKRAVSETIKRAGRLDGLVHNAGVTMRGLAADTNTNVFKQLMGTNYFSMVYLFQACLPEIIKSKGHIAAVSSMMGRFSTQYRSGYAASKHGLQGFLNSIRLELASSGVHVMTVTPGFVKTDISLNAFAADGSKHNKMDNATESGLEPEEAARIILKGLENRKRDVYPAKFKERFALFLSRVSPSLLDRILLKSDVT